MLGAEAGAFLYRGTSKTEARRQYDPVTNEDLALLNQRQIPHLALERVHHDALDQVPRVGVDAVSFAEVDGHGSVDIPHDEFAGVVAEAQNALCLDEPARLRAKISDDWVRATRNRTSSSAVNMISLTSTCRSLHVSISHVKALRHSRGSACTRWMGRTIVWLQSRTTIFFSRTSGIPW